LPCSTETTYRYPSCPRSVTEGYLGSSLIGSGNTGKGYNKKGFDCVTNNNDNIVQGGTGVIGTTGPQGPRGKDVKMKMGLLEWKAHMDFSDLIVYEAKKSINNLD